MDQRNLKVVSTNTTFIAMILLSLLQVTYAKGETCVVESIGGEKSASRETDLCGGDEDPCHHVSQCLTDRADAVKDIIIKGNYSSSTAIKINNNVSIRGVDNAIITGPLGSFLLEITGNKTKVNFNLTNIHFCGIGILNIRKHAAISIFNCTTTGVTGNVVWLHPEAEDIVVQLFESVFVDISDYVLKKASSAKNSTLPVRVHVDSCNFTRSKAIHLSCNSSVTVLLTSSVFSSIGSSVTVVANDRNRLSEVRLINCTFQDTSMSNTISSENAVVKVTGASNVTIRKSKFLTSSMKCSIDIDKVLSILIKECSFYGNYTTGAIVISKSSKAFIFRCNFLKTSAMRGGSIAATDLKTMAIHYCTFKDNRAGSFGGDVYIERNYEAVFNSNFFHNSSSGSFGGSVYAKKVTSVLFQRGNIFQGCFTEVHGGCIYVQETNEIEIAGNNSFRSCSSNKYGGCIDAYKIESIAIEGSNSFHNCVVSEEGGCISIYNVNDLEIKGNNSFHNCSSNIYGGCILFFKVDRLQIVGRNSFAYCSAGEGGGCVYAYEAKDVGITGSTFTSSIARSGGAVGVQAAKEKTNIVLTNCTFKDNGAGLFGGDVYLDRVNNAVFNSNFFHNSSSDSMGGSVLVNKVTRFLFQSGNIFHGCFTEVSGGCIFVQKTDKIEIEGNNSFRSCSSNKYGGCILIYKVDRLQIVGRNSFAHCSAGEGGGCISADEAKDVSITGSTFTDSISSWGGAVGVWPTKEKTYIVITNCSFSQNQAKWDGGALYFDRAENITILHSYFFQNKANSSGGALSVLRKSNIHIAFTMFQANKAENYGGAINVINTNTLVINFQMKTQNYSSIISRCRFQNNEARFGGAVATTYEGKATLNHYTIEYTMFVNNSALVLGQAIFNNEQLLLHRVSVKAHEKSNVYHIYSFTNTIEIRTLDVRLSRHHDKNQVSPISSAVFLSSEGISVQGMNITCPVGFNVFAMNSSYTPVYFKGKKRPAPIFTYLTAQCEACPANTYMVARGKLTLEILTEESKPQIENHHCTKCPQGAICDKDVRATDNHWGYFISQSMLAFKTCPDGYCCTKQRTKCVSYNICAYPRTGTLCGRCEAGFKLSFHSSECIPKGGDCNFLWFALYVLIFSVGYTGTFIVVTNISDILGGIKELIQICRKTRNTDHQEDSSQSVDCHVESISMIARPNTSESTFSIAGFVQIIVLYLQVALMLKVKYQANQQNQEETSTNKVFESLSNFFNFRLALYQKICPSDSLTLPQKEAILFGIKMLTFSELVASMVIYALMIRFCRKIGIPRNIASALRTVVTSTPLDVLDEGNNINSDFVAEKPGKINFEHRLKMTYLKLLKLYFTPITQSALKMTHCVVIRDSYHLFVYGDLVCYKNWQIGIMTIILPGILMFPFSYDLSLRMLKKRVISSTNFVAVTACPHYALAVYACKYKSMKQDHNNELVMDPEEEEFARRVLEAEDLFSDKENSINWQTIQFYRTIVMNITTIIITNPMYRFLTLAPILFLFCIHDVTRKPYKDVRLNRLQALSSGCLQLVLLCNMVASVTFTADISMVDGVTLTVKICAVVEIMLYAIVPLYLPLWKVWDILVSKRRKKTE